MIVFPGFQSGSAIPAITITTSYSWLVFLKHIIAIKMLKSIDVMPVLAAIILSTIVTFDDI